MDLNYAKWDKVVEDVSKQASEPFRGRGGNICVYDIDSIADGILAAEQNLWVRTRSLTGVVPTRCACGLECHFCLAAATRTNSTAVWAVQDGSFEYVLSVARSIALGNLLYTSPVDFWRHHRRVVSSLQHVNMHIC